MIFIDGDCNHYLIRSVYLLLVVLYLLISLFEFLVKFFLGINHEIHMLFINLLLFHIRIDNDVYRICISDNILLCYFHLLFLNDCIFHCK